MTTLSYRPAGGGRCQPASDSHITSETICSRRRKSVNTCRSVSLDLLFIGALYDATLPSHQRWWIVPNWAECPSLSPRVTSFCRSCPQTCVKFRASNENADPKPDQTSSVHPGQDDSAPGSPSAVFVTVACSWLLVWSRALPHITGPVRAKGPAWVCHAALTFQGTSPGHRGTFRPPGQVVRE